MKCGIVMPRGDARAAMELAVLAESAGWDSFFVWEPVWGIDAWVCLAAAAAQTDKIQLGTLLSPLSRMRPWKIASEYATLDNLSGGRAILSVGLGAVDTGFFDFGEVTDIKQRAELMDESLQIVTGLFKGQPFTFNGKHYAIKPTEFVLPPPPIQQTIWVVGLLGSEKSMTRALQYDGLLPSVRDNDGGWRAMTIDDVSTMRELATKAGHDADYDIVVEGTTPGADAAKAREQVLEWEHAGATWWIESMWEIQDRPDCQALVTERIRQGPPV